MICVYCRLQLVDDGVVLLDSTGGDSCGMPLDDGNSNHGHCRKFAPDSWGADTELCIECLVPKSLHPVLGSSH